MIYGLKLVLAAAITLLSAICGYAAEPTFPPGSRIGLAPPPGFSAEGRLRGFVDRDREALILLVEMPPTAFGEISKVMTAANLKTQGVIQEKREAVALPAGKAFLIVGRQASQNVKFRKWILVAAIGDLTALITVQVPEAARTAYPDDVVRAALRTVVTRSRVPVEETITLLPFRINDFAGLRPVRATGSSIFLTGGPSDDINAVDQPHVVVAAAPGGPEQADQRDTFARTHFSGIAGFKDLRITGSEMLRLPGQQMHELRAEGKHAASDAEVKIIQWIKFGSGAFIQIIAVASAKDWPDAFPRFRSVRDGLATP